MCDDLKHVMNYLRGNCTRFTPVVLEAVKLVGDKEADLRKQVRSLRAELAFTESQRDNALAKLEKAELELHRRRCKACQGVRRCADCGSVLDPIGCTKKKCAYANRW